MQLAAASMPMDAIGLEHSQGSNRDRCVSSLPMSSEHWPADRIDINNNNNNNDITPSNTGSSNNSNIILDNNNLCSITNKDDIDSSSIMTPNIPNLPVTSASLLSPNRTQFSQPQQYQQHEQQQQEQSSTSHTNTNTHAHAGFPEDMTGGVFVASLHPLSSPSSPLSPSPSSSSVIGTSPALTTSKTMVPTLAAVTSLMDPRRDPANDEPSAIRLEKEEQEEGAGARGIQDKDAATSTTTDTTTATTTESMRLSLSTGTGSVILSIEPSDGSQSVKDDGLVVIEEYVSIERGSAGDDHKDTVKDTIQPTTSSSFHITQSAAVVVDKERLVSQLEIVPSKLDPPVQDISRKSSTLSPLQTSTTASIVKKSIPIPATAIHAATMDSENPYYSTSTAPFSATSIVPNSAPGFNFHSSTSGPSSERGSYLGIESPYPSPTPASSPTDYFSASWVLPPIPSFSEMGLTFDKSRSSSTNSNTKRETPDNAQSRRGNETASISHQQNHISHATHKPHRSGSDRQSAGTNLSEHLQQQQQEIVPDYDPFIFDQITSDENEAYILWSTTPESGTGGAAVSASIIETSPAVTLPRNNRSGAVLSPSASQQSAQSIPTPEPSSSSSTPSTVKRWSAGESNKTKNQGRDSFDHDRVRTQTPTATAPGEETFTAQSTAHGGASDATFSGSSLPSSPSHTKSPERISGPISMPKPAFSSSSASSKVNAKSAAALGSVTSKSAANQESRVIMAATIEKLVEKLTSDIDYTFLTDFFLIYRLFISPPALLRLLMARFQWALTEDTPQRQIVRVRTFVVLRHWLLNYFEYDFMGFRLLRRTLIQNLKLLITHPIICSSVRDQRIVHELRRLFQLKRKQYSHAVAQRSLEGSTARREHSIRSVQHDNAEHNGSERSVFEEQLSGGDSSDQGSELYSTDSQSEDDDIQDDSEEDDEDDDEQDDDDDGEEEEEEDVYEEVSSYIIDEGYSQRDQVTSENDKDSSDLEAEDRPNVDRRRSSVTASIIKARLPSPTFSAGSRQSNDVASESFSTSHHHHYHHHVSASADAADGTGKIHPRPRVSESSDSPHHHHHRSHTVPHFHEARSSPRPRPLSYVLPSIDTTSSYAFSPPESPLPLDAYSSSRPPYTSGPSSSDKKKTWSQYMAATVGQLSKVKRVFKPKSSQSIQDLRSGGPSTATSTQPFIPRGGAVDREFTKFGSLRSAAGPSRYWNEGRSQSEHRVSQSATMLDAMTATNSVVSCGEGYPGVREYHNSHEHARGGQWSSDEDGDLRSESTRKSIGDRTKSRTMNHCVDQTHSSTAQGLNHGGSRIAAAATPTEYGYSTMDEGEQHQLSRPASPRGLDPLSDDQELILEQRSPGHGLIPVEWDQLPSSSNNSRALRRTTPKRDNRASWMTFSSTSSSIFGAVLTQNHVPPSQAIRRGSEQLNVERFVERTFGSIAPPVVPAGEQRPAYRNMTRHKSTDALKTMASEDSGKPVSAATGPLSNGDLPGENTVQSVSPGMNGGRRSHTVAQHPHRQTVPIMHHHYHHHHYLQHRQSLQDYLPQRRHSSDVRTLQGWSTNMTTSNGDKRNATDLSRGISQNSISLLEGAAYVAALQETQRQLKLMTHQESGHRAAPSPPPVTIPPHSQTFRGHNSNGPHSPDFSVKSSHRISGGGSVEGRSYSNPNWRHLSDPDVSPLVVNHSNNTKSPKPNTTPTGTVHQQRGVNRISTPWYSGPSSSSHGVTQQQTRSQYENSYSQQRSPMTPRFQSIMSSASTVREYPPRAPTSVVLRYRSEAIAQQMCLIEREQLSEIQWFELVKAGWKKKSPEASSNAGTKAPAPSLSEEQNDADDEAVDGGDAEGAEVNRKSTLTASGRTSGSSQERSHQPSESPSVVRLVDRFNRTCNWVTSEILKATDIETRIKVIEKFIRIAHTCYSYHNFSSLTQVMLGLQAHEVSRLSRTWARVRSQETKMMEDLVEFTSPFHNWRHLRNAMKTMADEWGGAATGQDPVPVSVAVEVSSSSSPSGSKRSNKDGGGLFSKIALSSKDKQKDQHHSKSQQQNQQQQHYFASSSQTKSFSGPVFPSLVSTLSSRDKDKDKDANKSSSLSQQPMGGCIPFLGVYLSDLLFNTELPSYVEPKVPATIEIYPSPPLQTVEYLSSTTTSASLNRLSTSDASYSTYSSISSPGVSNNHTQGDHHLDATAAVATTIDPLATAPATTDGFPSPSYSLPTSSPSLSLTLSMSTSSSSTSSAPPTQVLPTPPSSSEQQQQQQQVPWMINMHKHRTIATIIRRILTFQKMAGRYPFLHDTEVYESLTNAIESPTEQLSDSEKERLSDLCEERFSMVGPLGPLSPSESLNSGLTSPAFPR